MDGSLTVDVVTGACEIIGLIFTISGGMFALFQWAEKVRQTHVEMVDRLFSRFLGEKTQSFFYDFIDSDNGDRWFEERFYKGTQESIEFEKQVDGFFLLFNKLCYWYFSGVISESEEKIFSYYLERLLRNEQAKKYLNRLENLGLKCTHPFAYLILYGSLKGVRGNPFDNYIVGRLWKVWRKLTHVIANIFSPFGGRMCRAEPMMCSGSMLEEGLSSGKKMNTCEERPSVLIRGEFKLFIIEKCQDNKDMLSDLCDSGYSKKHFGVSFPVLIRVDEITDELYRRYYVDDVLINEKAYRLCNHWYKRNIPLVRKWLDEQNKK